MVDLEAMRVAADEMRDSGCISWPDMFDEARAELAEHRRAPVTTGPSVAERLVAYRTSAMMLMGWSAGEGGYDRAAKSAESVAHAMLRAEREPEVSRG